jgi:hypothetical protein
LAYKENNATAIMTDIDIYRCGALKLQVEILEHCRTRRENALTEAPRSLAASIVIDDKFAGCLTLLSLERSQRLAIPETKVGTLRDHQPPFPTFSGGGTAQVDLQAFPVLCLEIGRRNAHKEIVRDTHGG